VTPAARTVVPMGSIAAGRPVSIASSRPRLRGLATRAATRGVSAVGGPSARAAAGFGLPLRGAGLASAPSGAVVRCAGCGVTSEPRRRPDAPPSGEVKRRAQRACRDSPWVAQERPRVGQRPAHSRRHTVPGREAQESIGHFAPATAYRCNGLPSGARPRGRPGSQPGDGVGVSACGDARTAAREGKALKGMASAGKPRSTTARGTAGRKPGEPHGRLRDATSPRTSGG
jgi:hypothetical protein